MHTISSIELDREDDGRWLAEALELPGVMTYGQTREEAIGNTERLAIAVIADLRRAHRRPRLPGGDRQETVFFMLQNTPVYGPKTYNPMHSPISSTGAE